MCVCVRFFSSLSTPGRPPSSTAHWSVVQSEVAPAWQLRAGREPGAESQAAEAAAKVFRVTEQLRKGCFLKGTVVQRLCPLQPQPERVCFYIWFIYGFYSLLSFMHDLNRQKWSFSFLTSYFCPISGTECLINCRFQEDLVADKCRLVMNCKWFCQNKLAKLCKLQHNFINQASKVKNHFIIYAPRVQSLAFKNLDIDNQSLCIDKI